jgi:hypothetical protein
MAKNGILRAKDKHVRLTVDEIQPMMERCTSGLGNVQVKSVHTTHLS